jgi:nucleotide-binding universal stress UspA family protein
MAARLLHFDCYERCFDLKGANVPHPFKAILCPIGFNGNYAGVLSMARRLEVEPGSVIHLLHVIPLLPPIREGTLLDICLEEGAQQQTARRRLEKIAWELLAGFNYKVLLASCETPDRMAGSVVNTAQQIGADLVIMATHGRVGLPHELFGSITEGVVRQCRRPVLTLRLES